jgi:NSS family neurotransmitter:Na+ symporter
MGMTAGFLILSFYSVVAGWTLAYVFRTASGVFTGATSDGVQSIFNGLIADPERLLAWHTLFMVMTTVVVSRGVKSGLEQAVRFLMPALFLLLLLMVGYAMNTGAYDQAIDYLFKPDFTKLTGKVVLSAMGQAFFSLSLGMGAIMIYGSYLSHNASITRMTFIIALMDTSVALLAGLAIFPLVFAYGLQPQGGPGLIFMTLPIAFGQMPGGAVFGSAFFLLLVFAAWTSSISLMEPIVTWLVENKRITRVKASTFAGGAIWLFGIGSLLSFNLWSEYKLFNKTFFDLADYVTSNIMLPLGGLLIAVFAVWKMSADSSRSELGLSEGIGYRLWRFLVRYLAPVAIILVLLQVTGILTWITGQP